MTKRGVAAAQANHYKLPGLRANHDTPIRAGERGEETNDERAYDVHQQRVGAGALLGAAPFDPTIRTACARSSHNGVPVRPATPAHGQARSTPHSWVVAGQRRGPRPGPAPR